MEICQHCGMYMKPFSHKKEGSQQFKDATCEFCGEIIAEVVDDKWQKVTPLKTNN